VSGDQRRAVIDVASTSIVNRCGAPCSFQNRSRALGCTEAHSVQQRGLCGNPIDDPECCGIRGHWTEQRPLVAHRTEIGHALTAIGEDHGQIADHAARIMTTTTPLQNSQAQRQRPP
jgi:hypothetical protein